MPGTKSRFSVYINAKPEDVFAYVSDLSKHGEWSDNPLEIEAIDDTEIAVGKRYKSTAQFRGSEVPGEQTVTEYEPPTKFSFHVDDTTSKHDHEFTFTPQGDGTLMERTARGQWSLGMWLVASTIGKMFIGKPAMKSAFAKLREKLEA